MQTFFTLDRGYEIATIIGAACTLYAMFRGVKFLTRLSKLFKEKGELIDSAEAANRLAAQRKDIADAAMLAAGEWRSASEALDTKLRTLDATVTAHTGEIDRLTQVYRALWGKFRLAILHIIAQATHIAALHLILEEHAPRVPRPEAPALPKELESDVHLGDP